MNNYILITISWLVGFVFFSAAWGKLEGIRQFQTNLVESFGLSKTLANTVAPILICIEVVIGLFVVSNSAYSYLAMMAALFAFLAFTLFLAYHWSQNARVKCNCFGEDDRPVSVFDLLRNLLVMLLMSVYLVFGNFGFTLDIETQVILAGLGLALSIAIIHLHDIALLFLSARGKV